MKVEFSQFCVNNIIIVIVCIYLYFGKAKLTTGL